MGSNSYLYFLFLLWLSYLIVSSILLFTKGFLLSKAVQRKNSTCLSYSEVPCADSSEYHSNFNNDACSIDEKLNSILLKYQSASSICLPSRTRVVLLIVDALRYDFTVFDDKNSNPLPFQNKLPVINNLVKHYPKHSRLYKFIADPPTTTMQRLKGLTTGSLPTFIDAGSNFATTEINEDNLIDQLIRHKHGVVFMGDDTWNGLYPNRFTRNFPYPSFNVWDLDTVDNGVRENLRNELDNNDWSLLIGHFLGVDHCGHRYGPNHVEMKRKLGEINEVINNTVAKINETENMVLFVIGDHGMTATGDHGGDSADEVTAAMFIYSNQPLSNFDMVADSVKQVDLVPTLCTLLGVPVPFQNLGILILDSLPVITKSGLFKNWQFSLYSLWANVQQVFGYIKEYADNEGTFDKEKLKSFQEKFSVMNAKIISVDNEEKFKTFTAEAILFLKDLRQLCEQVWIQFDAFSMIRGLLFIFLSTFFAFVIVDGMPADVLSKVFSSPFIYCSFVILSVATIVATVLYYLEMTEDLFKMIFFLTAFVSQVLFALLIVQNWEDITSNWFTKRKTEGVSNIICRFILIFIIGGLFSNSYIIEESFVLLFLLVTVVLIGSIGVNSRKIDTKKKSTSPKLWSWSKLKFVLLAIMVAVFVRGSAYFWKCRQEQQWCFGLHIIGTNVTKTETTKLQWTVTVIFLGMFVYFTKEWLRSAGNMNGYSLNITLAKFLPTTIVVFMSGYWAMKRMPVNKQPSSPLNSMNSLPWAVYALTALGLIVCLFKPLYAYVLPSYMREASVPSLYRKIKNIADKEKRDEDIPIIYGMGTIYSAAFITIGIYLTLLFALLLGDAIAPSAVIMFFTAAFVLIVTSVLRIEKTTNLEQLFEVPNISILVWIILAHYFFYASGHQPTFTDIAWEAAFIGTSGVFSSNFIPAALVIVNTFCSFILMGVLLPLVLITPFTIFVTIPSISDKKPEIKSEACKGEVNLLERDKRMMTAVFILSCKYIIGHAVRVFASMLAATIHCRHLMVWNIFAPKLIFESIGMFVTLGSVIIGYLILMRINGQAEKLIQTLNKLN